MDYDDIAAASKYLADLASQTGAREEDAAQAIYEITSKSIYGPPEDLPRNPIFRLVKTEAPNSPAHWAHSFPPGGPPPK